MNGVSFGYDADRRVIDDVSLRIPQGTSCAIVGPSGSGKTTLVNLMARFWDVDAGAVLLGGQDVRKGTAESLLAHVSMVFQNVYLFNDTVENNIKFGMPPPGAPAATSSSCSCRRATTRCSRRAAPASRAGSASASPSRAPS